MNFSRVLAVGAHPDDVEYSCLGYLLKLNEIGVMVDLFVASHGGKNDSTSGPDRILETKNSIRGTGFELFVNEDQSFDYFKLEEKIRNIIVSRNIDCVLVHSSEDSHQDHRLVHDITLTALRRLNCSVIKYRSPSTFDSFDFNMLIDITSIFDLKLSKLKQHVSQSQKPYMSRRALEAFHTIYNLGDESPKFYEQYRIDRLFL